MELPFERAAINNEPLPDNLGLTDSKMYIALRALYLMYRQQAISREGASREKQKLVSEYNTDKARDKMVSDIGGLWKRIEASAIAFRKDPTVENGKRFYEAVYNTRWEDKDGKL